MEDFGGVDMGIWMDWMGYETSSDWWMCLPLDAFDPTVINFGSGFEEGGLDFFSMD